MRGIAWSGRGKIRRVDVSTDGGRTWKAAALQQPVLPKAHTRFRYDWEWDGTPTEILSRAVDESGYTQPEMSALQTGARPPDRLSPQPGDRLDDCRRWTRPVRPAEGTRMTRLTLVIVSVFIVGVAVAAQSPPKRFGLGTPATPEQIAALDIDVRPDGTGLPAAVEQRGDGAPIYAQKCAACHGANGEGGAAEALVGAEPKTSAPFGPDYERWKGTRPDVPFTIGNYWPYATTLFDYLRRAMPANAPGSSHCRLRRTPWSHGCSRRTRSSRRAT